MLSAGAPTAPSSDGDGDGAVRGLYVALRVGSSCHKVAYPGVGRDSASPSFAAIHAGLSRRVHRLLVEISNAGHQAMPPISMSPAEIKQWRAAAASCDGRSQVLVVEGAGHAVDLVGREAMLAGDRAPGGHDVADGLGHFGGLGFVDPEVGRGAQHCV